MLAQINGRSLTEEARFALEHWGDASKADPEVQKRAKAMREEIEREAETKRSAISAVLGIAPGKSGSAASSTRGKSTSTKQSAG